jgi:hypothetical protein
MTTAGTYCYPPSAGTGNLLLSNPPFIMDTNQPTPKGLPELTEAEFLILSAAAGGADRPFMACNYGHALRIAQLAFTAGADLELEAIVKWMDSFDPCWDYVDALRAARRPKPPTLKEQALAVLDDCSARLDAAHENTLRRALEALPE